MSIDKRYDFILFFDVKDGNPNGDPDAGNLPRIDPETGNGLVTDVCLKRKVRNYVALTKSGTPTYEIYVKEKAILNVENQRAYTALGKDSTVDAARNWMCENFYDIRTFGAVMTTKVNCGQVRGPVQMTFARSVEPVVTAEHSITRMAVTTEEEAKKQSGDNRTMGRKFTIPYGLYKAYGFVSAPLAAQTGFSADDLSLFWDALENMFEHDRSAARGFMATQRLIIFEHSALMGNQPVQELFAQVEVKRVADNEAPARDFSDYEVLLNGKKLHEVRTVVSV